MDQQESSLSLVFAVLVDTPASWRGVKVRPAILGQLEAFAIAARAQPATRLSG